MMKTKTNSFLLLLAVLALSSGVFSQNVVFVLVDVSGNPLRQPRNTHINPSERRDAINLVNALLLGNYSSSDFNGWNPIHRNPTTQFSARPMLVPNSRLFLIPYGNQNRYRDFEEFVINNPAIDINGFMNTAYNLRYTDTLTFEQLAIAKAVRISKDNNYPNFLMFKVGGLGGDRTGSETFDAHEQSMLDESVFGASITPIGLFRIANPNKELTVAILEFNIRALIDTIQPDSISPKPELRIISPSGSRSNPFKQDANKPLLISWHCRHCEQQPRFHIRVTGIDGTSFGKSYTVDNAYTRSLNLDRGNYRISLSSGNTSASPVFVSVKGSSGGSWFFLVLIGVLIALLIYVLKKQFFNTGKVKDKFDDNTDFDDKETHNHRKDTRTANNSDEDYF